MLGKPAWWVPLLGVRAGVPAPLRAHGPAEGQLTKRVEIERSRAENRLRQAGGEQELRPVRPRTGFGHKLSTWGWGLLSPTKK